jgi:hypothetical protein
VSTALTVFCTRWPLSLHNGQLATDDAGIATTTHTPRRGRVGRAVTMSTNAFRVAQLAIGAVGVLLLGAYVTFTYGLLRSAKRQVQHLSQTLDLTRRDLAFRMRPWLGIEDIDPLDESQGRPSVWIIKARNYGAGVALGVGLSFVLRSFSLLDAQSKTWAGAAPEIEILPGQLQRIAVEMDEQVLKALDSHDVELEWDMTLSYRWGAGPDEHDSVHQVRRWIQEDRCWAVHGADR